jgi:hypothetical protein
MRRLVFGRGFPPQIQGWWQGGMSSHALLFRVFQALQPTDTLEILMFPVFLHHPPAISE